MLENKKTSTPVLLLTVMSPDNVRDVVGLHLLAFPDFFLTFLGKSFLSVYYNAIIHHDDAIKIALVNSSQVIGFVVGTMNPSGFYSTLIKNDIFSFAVASIPAIIRKPQTFFRLVRALGKPKQAGQGKDVSELTSLAVLPQYHGHGYGQLLVDAFIRQCRERSGRKIMLTTDAMNNEKVNSFYTKAGFGLVRSFTTPEQRVMNEYQYIIS